MTFKYRMEVLSEEGEQAPLQITIESSRPIETRLLSVAGLLLDGGIENGVVDPNHDVSKSYVSVHQIHSDGQETQLS